MSREIELLTLGGFGLSGGFFLAVLDEGWPRRDKSRCGWLALSGALLGVALVARGPWWTIALSSLVVVMSLIGVACAAHIASVRPGTAPDIEEPAWWRQFELDLAEYVSPTSVRQPGGSPRRES